MNNQINHATNAAAAAPPPPLLASNWKQIDKKTLVGTCDITTPSGFIFRGVMVHERASSRWVQLPSREYQKADGTRSFSAVIEFATPEKWKQFSGACIDAVDVLLFAQQGGAA